MTVLRRPARPVVSRKQALVFGFVLAAAVVPLVIPVVPGGQSLAEGDRAPRRLEAAQAAQYVSDALTSAARDEAAKTVADVPLPVDPTVRLQQTEREDRLLDAARTLRQTGVSAQQQLTDLGALPAAAPLSLAGRSALLSLDRPTFDDLQVRAQRALADVFQKPIQQNEILIRIDEYLGQPGNQPASVPEFTALRELLRVFVVPNFQVDTEATNRRREDARNNVAPAIVSYTAGQAIASEGQELRKADIEALEATGVITNGYDAYEIAAGVAIAFGFGCLLAVALFAFQPFPAPARPSLAVTGIVVAALLLLVRAIVPAVTPDLDQHALQFAVPVAAAAIVVAVLGTLEFAIVASVAMGLAAAIIDAASPDLAGASFVGPLESVEMAAVYIASGVAAAFVLHRAERIGRLALAGPAAAGGAGLVMLIFWLIGEPRDNASLGWIAVAAGINGAGSLLLGVLVVFPGARIAHVATRFQLRPLADEQHPLRRRLEAEAPGTYHHSQMVAALAERAAERIGADVLVARLGAYYHDIGKLAKPGYYIENMLDGAPNPHDFLAADASARAIRDHVQDGLRIARHYGLPSLIQDFIPQHHGTRLVSYFYRRAGSPEVSAAREPFQYAGPRPQSKEAAVVMLADACEAVVRARQASDGASMDLFVDGIVSERLREGQFDECDITMRDLQEVADSFKTTLRAIYHPRIEYPAAGPEEIAQLRGGRAAN
jgi:hypothetical protein